MKNNLLIGLPLVLTACGGGGSGSGATWAPGIYGGDFTATGGAPQPSVVMVTSDNRALFTEVDAGSVGLGSASGATITFDTNATATLTNTLSGNFNFVGVTGTFALADLNLYNRGADLARLNGTWVDNTYMNVGGVSTWTINNGSYNLSMVSGCSATGSFGVINTAYNEYTVTATVSNCGVYNGSYTGLAFTEDTNFTNDTVRMLLESDSGSSVIIGSPIKQ